MQDYERQLSALLELKSYLEVFKEEIGEKLIMYSNKFLALRESGLPVQIAENYAANYCNTNTQVLRNLIGNITEQDLPYVNANINIVEQALEKARMS